MVKKFAIVETTGRSVDRLKTKVMENIVKSGIVCGWITSRSYNIEMVIRDFVKVVSWWIRVYWISSENGSAGCSKSVRECELEREESEYNSR